MQTTLADAMQNLKSAVEAHTNSLTVTEAATMDEYKDLTLHEAATEHLKNMQKTLRKFDSLMGSVMDNPNKKTKTENGGDGEEEEKHFMTVKEFTIEDKSIKIGKQPIHIVKITSNKNNAFEQWL